MHVDLPVIDPGVRGNQSVQDELPEGVDDGQLARDLLVELGVDH